MIKIAFPPNHEDIKKVFTHQRGSIYCFGKDIYNPDNCPIDEPQLAHEAVHTKQQGGNPIDWWKRYLLDDDYRFVQELEAFQAQYKTYCKKVKDRNFQMQFLFKLATSLSSETYRQICSRDEAMQAIKSKIKFKV